MRGTVVIFVKAPIAGRVKTRLAADVGLGRATALFRVLTAQTIAQSMKGSWQTVLAVDPPSAVTGYENLWPQKLQRYPQVNGDLGARMRDAFQAMPKGPVLIIGADAPGLRMRHLREAFRALGRADAVFGPAKDGGYWLIGLSGRKSAPDLFDGVRWSTKYALSDTIKTLPANFTTHQLESLRDIDMVSDLVAMGPRTTRS